MNTSTKTTIAGIVAAASIGTGVLIFNDSSTSETVKAAEWKMPTIDVPELIIPTLPTYGLNTVESNTVELFNEDLSLNFDSLYENVNINGIIDHNKYSESFNNFLIKITIQNYSFKQLNYVIE
jgi:hypothetical protein